MNRLGQGVDLMTDPAKSPITRGAAAGADTRLMPGHIEDAARRLRRVIASASFTSDSSRAGAVFEALRSSIAKSENLRDQRWQLAIRRIARQMGCSEQLLELSISALTRPLAQVCDFARMVKPRRELLGFVLPGNVPGAGLHEIVIALLAGCGLIVKSSAAEPVFFAEFAATLNELDVRFGTAFGKLIEVFNWGRERTDLTRALLDACDCIAAFGDDITVAEFERRSPGVIGFASRVSGAALLREAVVDDAALEQNVRAISVDCALFDQRGCLSPQHIFVEERAEEFAARTAAFFQEFAPRWGDGVPRIIGLENAAAIRAIRESVRWRRLGGAKVRMWEGAGFDWTVVFDRDARFTISPGFRTVFVSPFTTLTDFERRLQPVHGRLEGFALAGRGAKLEAAAATLRRLGATYICPPGEMQSPPLDWPHGGGAFLRLMLEGT